MAHVEPTLAFDNFSGKLSKKERIVMRTRNGRTHAYAVVNPDKGPISENRKRVISSFSQAVKQCKIEMADPELLAAWQDRYNKHLKARKRKYYSTLRGFIIASLSIQLRSAQGDLQ